MKRLMMSAVVIGWPILAVAQTAPPPAAPPAPVTRPFPLVAPKVMVSPELFEPAIAEAMQAMREGMAIEFDQQAAREQAQQAREEAQRAMEDMRGQLAAMGVRSADGDYNIGLAYLSQRKYEQAVARFDRVVADKGDRADGALYWKAYAQYKLAKSDEALATIAKLRSDFAQSRYLTDARALEADVRKAAGQPVNPVNLDDDEIKLLAIQGIQNSDPERAVPLLEGVLSSTNSLAVKKRALYVLALSNHPKARQILLNYAKGGGTPDLQVEAIRYIAIGGDKQTTGTDLRQIYEGTQDVNVKAAVLNAYRAMGGMGLYDAVLLDRAVEALGRTETAPTVVRRTTSSATSSAAVQELWTIYQRETNKDLRLQIVGIFGSMQALDQLNQVLKTEKDPTVRRRAVRSLGNLNSDKTGAMLVSMYSAETDVETRKAVIGALRAQNNAEALIAIARKETSLDLKRAIIQQLSDMAPRSKVAADYLMEIIK